MPHNGKGNHRVSLESQLAVVTAHLERVKDVAVGLGQTRAIWTASAAEALAAYIQTETDAALLVLQHLEALGASPKPAPTTRRYRA
jgi:hypothetical protein